jgi:hypothetical protein
MLHVFIATSNTGPLIQKRFDIKYTGVDREARTGFCNIYFIDKCYLNSGFKCTQHLWKTMAKAESTKHRPHAISNQK